MIVKLADLSAGDILGQWTSEFKSPDPKKHLHAAAKAVNESLHKNKATTSILKSAIGGIGSLGRAAYKHPAIALGVGIPIATGLTVAMLKGTKAEDSEF